MKKVAFKDRFTKEEFIDMYNKNTVTDLCKTLKVSRPTIIGLARKYNLPYKKNGGEIRKHKTVKIEVKELERLYKTMRTKDLAKRLNLSVTTLVKILKEHGIEIKKAGFGYRERKIIVEG